jgi:PKHD-type hydroxylase
MKYHWYCYQNFFSKDEAKQLNNLIIKNKNINWVDNVATGSPKNCEVIISDYGKCKFILNKVVEYMYHINNTIFGFNINNVTDYNKIFLNIYNSKNNAYYDFHYDGEPREQPYTSKLTLLINTSEEEYSGGEFFIFSSKEKEIKEFSTTGSILIFPSIFFHAVKPITNGIRKSVALWGFGPHWK